MATGGANPSFPRPEVRDLAAKIYVDFVGHTLVVSGSSAKMAADAALLAQMSFELAEVFQRVQDKLNEANLPKNQDFKLDNASIDAWSKP